MWLVLDESLFSVDKTELSVHRKYNHFKTYYSKSTCDKCVKSFSTVALTNSIMLRSTYISYPNMACMAVYMG